MAFSKLLKRSTVSTPLLNLHVFFSASSSFRPFPFTYDHSFCTNNAASSSEPKDEKSPAKAITAIFTETKAKLVLTSEGLGDPWVVEEDEEAIYTKCDMPGISKSGLKLVVQKCSEGVSEVSFKGEELDRDPSFYKASEKQRKVEGNIIVVHKNLNMNGVRSHFNNGVLRVVFLSSKKSDDRAEKFLRWRSLIS